MLTIKFDKLGVAPGDQVLDVGAGFGRHVFECARRSADVVALDYAEDEVVQTRATLGAMVAAGDVNVERFKGVLRGDATSLPFNNGAFDVVITSEVLEHIQDDVAAIPKWCASSSLAACSQPPCLLGYRRRSTGCLAMSTTHRSVSEGTCASTLQPS